MRECSYPSPLPNTRPKIFAKATETNLWGFFYVSQLAASQMRLQKSGHIVNITSSIVDQPVAGLTGSVVNLTAVCTGALAIEFARDGVRFNSISPGVVNTPMHQVFA